MQKYLPTPGLVGETLKGVDLAVHQIRQGEFAMKVTRLNYGTHLAGIRIGDVIISASGRSDFASTREFFHWCEVLRRQGKDLKLGLIRKERKMHVMVSLNYLNFPSVEKSPEIMLGFTAQEVGWETGLRVGNVRDGSSAEHTGLKHGDGILLVDGQKMLSYKKLEEHLNLKLPGDLLTLQVKRGDKVLDIAYVLADKESEKSDLAALSAEVQNAGQELTCSISINLQEGDHIYSMHKKGFGLPTKLEFRGTGFKLLESIKEPAPVKKKDKTSVMWVHQGALLFKQKIVVTDPDNFNLVLRVYAQVCDDKRCSELRSVISNRGNDVTFTEYQGDFDALPEAGK